MTLGDLKNLKITVYIPEDLYGQIKLGDKARVTVDSFPDQIFKGQVDSVSPLVEERSRTVKIRSKISNVDERLRPGMFGRVNVLVYEKEHALVIPSSSFKKKEDQYFVYLVHIQEEKPTPPPTEEFAKAKKKEKKGKAAPAPALEAPEEEKPSMGIVEIRNIEVAYTTPEAIEVKEGLEEGDLVIVDVEQELQDKAKVEITETQEGIF